MRIESPNERMRPPKAVVACALLNGRSALIARSYSTRKARAAGSLLNIGAMQRARAHAISCARCAEVVVLPLR